MSITPTYVLSAARNRCGRQCPHGRMESSLETSARRSVAQLLSARPLVSSYAGGHLLPFEHRGGVAKTFRVCRGLGRPLHDRRRARTSVPRARARRLASAANLTACPPVWRRYSGVPALRPAARSRSGDRFFKDVQARAGQAQEPRDTCRFWSWAVPMRSGDKPSTGRRLTTGCSGQRFAPPLNRSVRPHSGAQ